MNINNEKNDLLILLYDMLAYNFTKRISAKDAFNKISKFWILNISIYFMPQDVFLYNIYLYNILHM